VKILFDCRYTRIGRHDGISRYTAGLVTALGALHPVTMMISDEKQLSMLPDLPWVLGPSPTAITELGASLIINRFNADVVFTPMQTLGPWGRRFRLVNTVHDLIYYSNRTPPRSLPWPVRLGWRIYHLSWTPQRVLLRSADENVAVSETTRELMLRHRLTPHPVTIVADAVEPVDVPDAGVVARPAAPPERSLVYMGSFMPYKNVALLARAMHLLPEYHLHLLSRVDDTTRSELLALAPADSLTFHNGVTDEEYHRVLRASTALVTASRAEGFGLPLVESMAHGTPVVVSDIPVFREIGADAAVYFDPASARSLAAGVRSLEEPGRWEEMSRLSVTRAANYSWDASARALLEVLKRVTAADSAGSPVR
jgi:glycosyltransferase involved in cell wall biosynthesis